MPVPLTQKRRFRALAGLIARQKIPLDLPEIKKLSDEQKWYLFETYMQKHLEFQEDMKEQAFKLLWKIAAKAWRQFRFQLRRDFVRKGLEPFGKHDFIKPEEWTEFVKQQETEEASSVSGKFKSLRSLNTNEHSMGPAGYCGKLPLWEEEDRKLAAAGIANPYDAITDDRSRNWMRARSKLVVTDGVAKIVINKVANESVAADIMEKNAHAESSGMTSWLRENDVLSQCLGRPEQPGRVCGVSSYQGWKFAWPQHASMYRKRKRAEISNR